MNLPPVSISLSTRLPKPFRLRKAAARRLAEAGCSANEIAAITAHAKLEEAARYTKAAEQKRLAASGNPKHRGRCPSSYGLFLALGISVGLFRVPREHQEDFQRFFANVGRLVIQNGLHRLAYPCLFLIGQILRNKTILESI